jgi:glycerol-3-phosphate dehydrogenase
MDYDIAIIGGGINGCGIARDAAGRGLSVFLCEQGDLGGGTSSASTKLIHGGLRYLEHRAFRLVRESLAEREVLMRLAPHVVRPLRFVLPHHAGLRPRWLLRLGLYLYDRLAGESSLPGTRTLDLVADQAGRPLKPSFRHGFEYSDCWADDARLVVLNAVDARDSGAEIRTRTRCVSATRIKGGWSLTTEHAARRTTVTARALVNATGPWVSEVLGGTIGVMNPHRVRLVKGSHIVVDRLFDHDRAYLFQNGDGRIVFAIPYERDFTLIGTTDGDYKGDPAHARIDDGEIAYLCAVASDYFRAGVTPDRIRWSYCGVRPLYDDGASKAQDATRDYVLDLDRAYGGAPLLTVFGGKLTTYRTLAEAALEKLRPHLQMGAAWTAKAALPGGHFAPDGRDALIASLSFQYPFLDEAEVIRLVHAYGTDAFVLLDEAHAAADMGHHFGAGLTEREVRYLMRREWAECADDVVWRRTKLGLYMTRDEITALDRWMFTIRGGVLDQLARSR